MSRLDELETLRNEIDRIDEEIVEKIAAWVRASKEQATIDEALPTQIQGLAREHGVDIEGVERIFRALLGLVEEKRSV